MTANLLAELAAVVLGKKASCLEDWLSLCEAVGANRDAIVCDLESVVKERLMMWLVGEFDTDLNYIERRHAIQRRLARLMDAPRVPPGVVDHVARFQAAVSSSTTSRKEGLASLDEFSIGESLRRQGSRCDICGVPLRTSARKQCLRFPDGVEPVLEMELDHILPFYIAGNDGGFRLLCGYCNVLKSDRLGVQEDGFVIAGNHLRSEYPELRRRAGFWTLARRDKCGVHECPESANSSLLWVSRVEQDAAWYYGNLSVHCTRHAPATAEWIHQAAVFGTGA